MSQLKRFYPRFTVTQRIEHWVMTISFIILGVTGLPQKFAGTTWAESMIAAMGGIESVRIIHRYAAIVLMAVSIYHIIAVAYKMLVKRVQLSMMPGWQDALDMVGIIAYNLGFRADRPKMPRYNFEEKMEYWAVVWGTVIMVITGFMLWNPIATANFLPGSFIPAAKAAHGGEALLAILAIIVWHMYGVHLRKFNPSMFNGKLSAEAMEHEHALELEQIESGTLPPPPPREDQARRARIFIPIATVIALVMLAGLYWFVTFEQTAISTVLADEADEPTYKPVPELSQDGGIHFTIEAYAGPESCAGAGCHTGGPVESANASLHNRRITLAGPNPWMAKLVGEETPPGTTSADCLLCHARDYKLNDPLASAHTVHGGGGESCLRCHSEHPTDDVHVQVGVACVSCHFSEDHQISAETVACTNCHDAMPHTDPFLNSKHTRLDCRTCHIPHSARLVVDASQPVQDPVTGFYGPTVTRNGNGNPTYAWQTGDKEAVTIDTEGAVIVPVVPVTILAPADLNPAIFARNGKASGEVEETVLNVVPSHGITKTEARTCETCHGPAGSFDFAALGYDEEHARALSVKSAEPTE